jgi:hypothetical protein
MIADLTRVRLESCDPHFVIGSVLRIQERLQRRLCVHNDVLAARQMNDQIGAEPAVVALKVLLFVEVASLQHARNLDDPPQLHFSPPAANGRRSQGARQ